MLISIHALREEGDVVAIVYVIAQCDFYPRPPRGGRPNADNNARETQLISIHALREEGDGYIIVKVKAEQKISIHALREEGDS